MDEHPLVEKATITIHTQYPQAEGELFALLVAHQIFEELRKLTYTGPASAFVTVLHAQHTVNEKIKSLTADE